MGSSAAQGAQVGNDVEVLPQGGRGAGRPREPAGQGLRAQGLWAVLRKMQALRVLELAMVPPRPSACSILIEVAGPQGAS